jgi:hypothetical protein
MLNGEDGWQGDLGRIMLIHHCMKGANGMPIDLGREPTSQSAQVTLEQQCPTASATFVAGLRFTGSAASSRTSASSSCSVPPGLRMLHVNPIYYWLSCWALAAFVALAWPVPVRAMTSITVERTCPYGGMKFSTIPQGSGTTLDLEPVGAIVSPWPFAVSLPASNR